MIKNLTKLVTVIALFFSIQTFAQTLPGFNTTLGVTYTSKLLDKGQVIDGANTIVNAGAGFGSFQFNARAYNPTQVGQKVKIEIQRVEIDGTYGFASTLGNVAVGATYKHYNNVVKGAQLDHFEPLARLESKLFVPVYLQGKYQIDTRQVNLESGANLSFDFGAGVKFVPSVYVGYNDISDQFPRNKKAIKLDNRYYGAGLILSKKVWKGQLSVGAHTNRADHAFANTTNYWDASYSVKL